MGVIQFFGKFTILALVKNIELILRFLLMFLFYYLGYKSLISLTYVLVIPSIVTFFISFCIVKFNKEIQLGFISICFSNKKSIFFYWFSWQNFLSTVIKAGNKQIDSLIVAKFISVSYVGIYDLVKKFITPINLISNVLSINMLTEIIKSNGGKSNLYTKIKRINIKLSLVLFCWTCVLIIITPLIQKLLSIQYSITIFIGLIIVNFLNQTMWWTRAFSTAYNQKLSIYFNTLASVLSCTILLILVFKWGIWGLIGGLFFIRILLYYFWNQKLKEYAG